MHARPVRENWKKRATTAETRVAELEAELAGRDRRLGEAEAQIETLKKREVHLVRHRDELSEALGRRDARLHELRRQVGDLKFKAKSDLEKMNNLRRVGGVLATFFMMDRSLAKGIFEVMGKANEMGYNIDDLRESADEIFKIGARANHKSMFDISSTAHRGAGPNATREITDLLSDIFGPMPPRM